MFNSCDCPLCTSERDVTAQILSERLLAIWRSIDEAVTQIQTLWEDTGSDIVQPLTDHPTEYLLDACEAIRSAVGQAVFEGC